MIGHDTGPPVAVMAAGLTVDSHQGGRRCPHCTPAGCPKLATARRILDAYRAARRKRWSP